MKSQTSLITRMIVCSLGLISFLNLGCDQAEPLISESTQIPSVEKNRPEESPEVRADSVLENPSLPPPEPSVNTSREVDGIPLDVWPEVWFEDPLSVAASGALPNESIQEQLQTMEKSSSGESLPFSTDPNLSESGKPQSFEFASETFLKQEVKNIRLAFKQAFQSVQRYNAHYQELQIDGMVLAVLADVVANRPGNFAWNKQALQLRDLAINLVNSADGVGRSSFTPASGYFEQIEQILIGNVPGDLPTAHADRTIAELASRDALMQRMQRSADFLKENSGDRKSFQAAMEELEQESLLIALLAQTTSAEGYDLADEPEYSVQADLLFTASLDAVQAAKQNDIESFQQSLQKITSACNNCHRDFRFENE